MNKEKKQTKKASPRRRRGRKNRAAEMIRFGKLRAKLGLVKSICGRRPKVQVPKKRVPLIAIFVNFGICSIEVTISGDVGPAVSVMIPSKAGWGNRELLLHPLATDISIECLPTVPGGDCRVGYILIW
jgi:hypothetical protein